MNNILNTVLIILVFSGAILDWKYRKIPNWLTFGGFFLAVVIHACSSGLAGILSSVLGFLVGLLLLLIPYLLGGMGAGDVKLLGAVGALVGCKSVINIFIYSAVSGLFLSLLWIIFTPGHFKFLITTGQAMPVMDKKQKFPYGIAIFLGTTLNVIFPDLVYKVI